MVELDELEGLSQPKWFYDFRSSNSENSDYIIWIFSLNFVI